MATNKHIIHGIFGDEVPMMEAIKKLRASGIRIKDVFSPMPVHGLDSLIGLPRTRIAICAFIYGLTGLGLATLMMWYMMVSDWPNDIGGKPNFSYLDNMLAFVPISFEFTVLCAAHGMAITYLLRNKTLPGMPAQNPDPRTTDDKFVMEIRLNENHGISEAELDEMLKETGFFELDKKEIN